MRGLILLLGGLNLLAGLDAALLRSGSSLDFHDVA